jgi:hypothetical protein
MSEQTTTSPPLDADERTELDTLRRRVAELEAERFELARRANAAVAAAQRRSYWLDRWHVDLNAVMDRPFAGRARAAARALRGPLRAARGIKRRLLG